MVIMAEPRIEIQNMVACADLKARIDLEDLALNLRKTIYEPENFPGLIYVMDEPKVTLLLFTNGKIVCAGAKSENDVYRAVAKIHDTLETKGLIEPETSETIAESRPSPQTEIHAQRQEPEEIACLATNSSA